MGVPQKKRYDRLKAAGICIQCGKEKALPGRIRCKECSQKGREYQNKIYQLYKEKGICVKCHQAKAEPGSASCRECSEKERINKKRREFRKTLKAIKSGGEMSRGK